jgi:hypothetical protein
MTDLGRRRWVASLLTSVALACGWLAIPAAADIPDGPPAAVASTPSPSGGYWTADAAGRVTTSGGATHRGDLAGLALEAPVVGMAATPSGLGYWMVASDGGVFAFGDAPFLGSAAAFDLWAPVVGIAATPTGLGYWMVASDGGVFAFGDARFHGSAGGVDLWAPVVDLAATPTGLGYWLLAGDGGVFTFGDAPFLGSRPAPELGARRLHATPSGLGYWIADGAGGVTAFGEAAQLPPPAHLTVPALDPGPTDRKPSAAEEYLAGLPADRLAVWDALAACESGGDWAIDSGNSYYGGLQFSLRSWQSVGGVGFPHQHPRAEQIYRAELLLAAQGWSAWPGCARVLGRR